MRTNKTILLTLLVAAITALTGCGSSGSSSDGQASGNNTAGLILTGFVTDNPIQGATVTATVNGESFTADQPSGSDGAYQIEVRSEDPSALVRLEAVDASGSTRLSAIVDSFEAIEQVLADTSSDEDFNITNVTTAQEVLAKRLTEDGSIDSKEELADAVARVETDDLLELSAAIKLVVDNIDGVVLPGDVEDTLALAEAIVSGESTFIEDIEQSAPGALDNAVDLVLSDGNATIAFNAETVPGVYLSDDNTAVFAFFTGGYGFTESQGEGSAAMFDWQVTQAGVLNIFIGGSAPRTDEVILLGRTDDIVNVVVREDGATDRGEPSTARYFAFDDGFTTENLPGSYSTLNEPGHLTVFVNDGTGYDLNAVTGVQNDAFTWAIDEAGSLTITDADGTTTNAYRLAGSTDDNPFLLVAEQDANGQLVNISLVDALRSDAEFGSDEANALLLAGSTYAMTETDEIGLFTFGTDGTFREIIQQQDEATGAWSAAEGSGSWSIDAQGAISILFPDDPETAGGQIISGLGEDLMVVQTSDDSSAVIQVMRVVPIEAALVPGSFSIQDEVTGASTETVRFLENGIGTHIGADGVVEDFTWYLNSNGRLVVEVAGDNAFDNDSATFYQLAGGSGDIMRFVVVHRVNGELDIVESANGEIPDTLSTLTLIRNG